jgi:hypothetical protein
MTWTAPQVDRDDEPQVGDEWVVTVGRLERNRQTFLVKCAGLTGEQLAMRAVPPSSLSLLGLIRHLTDTERVWFRNRFHGEGLTRYHPPGVDFEDIDPANAEHEYGLLVAETELCRQAVVGASLDDTFGHERWGVLSLRWLYGHMIEEYARHNGHADLLRERTDGVTGG